MQRRYFEYIGGTSRKFWEVTVDGCHVTVRFGRIATQGQSQSLPLPDVEIARHHAAKLAAGKLKKGYVEVAPGVNSETQSGSEQCDEEMRR